MAGRLTTEEIEEALAGLAGWRFEDGMLVSDWRFADFPAAMRFVNEVAALAERLDHHPDIDIRYSKVRLGLVSHDANGITSRDVRFAREVRAGEAV